MKMTFLGTGASEGIPAFRCGCPVCMDARKRRGRSIRLNSSVYVESDGGLNILIDMPGHIKMSLDALGDKDRGIDIILFTHFHIDHTGGIFYLLESKAGSGHRWDRPLDVYMPRDIYQNIEENKLYTDMPDPRKKDPSFFSLHVLEDREKVSRKGIEIRALNTRHLQSPRECHGYLFDDRDTRYAYMVDASSELPETSFAALEEKPLDCLIYECTFDRLPDAKRAHSDIEGVLSVRDRLKPKRMIITHISHRNLPHEELTVFMEKQGIETAWDGMTT
jgi:phosphoribosyl 1,2-cyclic phosphate phosphodiesterase